MIAKFAVPLLIGIALIAVSIFLLLRREALVAYFVANMRSQVQHQVGSQIAVAFGLMFIVMGVLLLSKGNKAGIILLAASFVFFVWPHFWGQLYLRQANWMATSSLWANSQRLAIFLSASILAGVGLRFLMSVLFAFRR